MADYISTLTGVQMDAALIDMAEHNSEAWAVGERNGTDVNPDDVTYHNNARYYAQQAQSIAPASVTEAVRWDIAQTALTDANKEMARANIDAGKNGAWTNPNLLDNPWFTVNQRSAATLPVGGYGVDRWKGGSSGSVTVASGGLQFVGKGNAYQIPPSGFWDSMTGKTVTASLLFSDGTVQGGSGVIGSGVTEFGTYNDVRISKSSSNNFNLESNSDANCIVRAVKLELGSVSTLANDTPPDYGTELLKCLRYQWVVNAESVYGVVGEGTVTTQNTEAMMVVHFPVPMHKVPTLSKSGAFRTVGGNGTTVQVGSITNMSVTTNASNKNFARVTINGTNMGNTGTSVVVGADNNAGAYLIFDANL